MASERKSADAFEAALKRELQNAPASNAADCPAPEILAAYYDRTLSRSERARFDAHLVSCVRCQSMMASIARANETERSSPQVEPTRGLFWVTRLLAPVAVVAVVIAIAIGIRTREQRAPEVIALASPAVSAKLELAERAAPPPREVASQSRLAPQVPSAPPAAAVEESQTAKILAPHRKRSAEKSVPPPAANSTSLQDESASSSPAPPQNAAAPIAREVRAPSATAGSAFSSASKMMAKAPVTAGELPQAAPSERKEIAEEKSESPLTANSTSMRAEAPSTVQRQNAQMASEMPATSAAAGSALSGTTTMKTTAQRINQVSSPDGSVAWQFGAGGAIMRSGNSSPWLALRSGVTTDLLAASAPSNDVCWMVGKSGTIVRTLDSGVHWQLIKPPSRENFTAIAATDSNNATVIASNGQRFTTHDGGVTWSSR